MKDNIKANVVFYCFGIIPVVWIALLIAPYIDGGLIEIVKELLKIKMPISQISQVTHFTEEKIKEIEKGNIS